DYAGSPRSARLPRRAFGDTLSPLNALPPVPARPTRHRCDCCSREPCARDTIGTPIRASLEISIGYIEPHIPTRGEATGTSRPTLVLGGRARRAPPGDGTDTRL